MTADRTGAEVTIKGGIHRDFQKFKFNSATAAACNCDNEALQFGNKDNDAASATSVRPREGGEVIRCLSRYAKHAGNSIKRFGGSAR